MPYSIYGFLVILIVIAVLVYSVYRLRRKLNQSDSYYSDLWRLQELVHPLIAYLVFCKRHHLYVSDDGLKAFLGSRHIVYNEWIEECAALQQRYMDVQDVLDG